MRVLMISKACVVGIYQRKLEAIARLGVELAVIVPPVWRDPSGNVPLEKAFTQGYRLWVDPVRFNGSYHLYHFPTLARRLREFRPDILHIDEEPYNLATWHALRLARGYGVKALFFSWQNILRRYPPPFDWGERWTLHRADYALMGTQSAAEVFRAKGYQGPLTVAPQFGVDPDLFQPRVRLANPVPVVGFIARLRPEKGAHILIQAVGLLARRGVTAQIRIVGQGAERPTLEALAAAEGIASQVIFAGQVPSVQMPELYPSLDVLIIPSLTLPNWKEQFGRVIVEAMACGVPVIGSNSGAIPDVIGNAGVIVPEGDVEALASALAALLADSVQRAELAALGRARVMEFFTHARIARHTVAAYEAILKG